MHQATEESAIFLKLHVGRSTTASALLKCVRLGTRSCLVGSDVWLLGNQGFELVEVTNESPHSCGQTPQWLPTPLAKPLPLSSVMVSDCSPYLLALWPTWPHSSHLPFLSQALRAPLPLCPHLCVSSFVLSHPHCLLVIRSERSPWPPYLKNPFPTPVCPSLSFSHSLQCWCLHQRWLFPQQDGRSHRVGAVLFFALMYPGSKIGTQDVATALHKVSRNERLEESLSEFCF